MRLRMITALGFLAAATMAAGPAKYAAPKTAWGDPKLEGVYTNDDETGVPFERPAEFIGKELEIAGSELSNVEAAKVFSRVLGKPVKFQKLPLPLVRLILGREFYTMFRWFNEAGFKADIAGLRRTYPEVHFQTLEEWLRSEGWHKRAKHVRAPKE